MYRIDDPSASPTLPAPESALTEGYWTEGNPGSGIPATLERASWFNMVQEELRAIVVAAGFTPSKTTYTQVRDAIAALYVKTATANSTYAALNGNGLNIFSAAASASGSLQVVPRSQADALYAPIAGTRFAVIATAGSFVVPAGITTIFATLVGGGGSGGGGGGNSTTGGAGGGGGGGQGQTIYKQAVSVTPGQVLTVGIGSGGTFVGGGNTSGSAGTVGNPGGSTTLSGTGVSVVAAGGSGGGGGTGNTTASGVVGGGSGGAIGGGANFGGGQAGGASTASGGTVPGVGGAGGATIFGAGGATKLSSSGGTGAGGVGYGAGGSGGTGGAVSAAAGGASGSGNQGVVLLEW